MATHFAAVQDFVVLGYRSSTSRHAAGTGRFGLYTHAVLRHTRTTIRTEAGSESVSWSSDIISWHNGPANAAAGLREAHVGAVHCYGRDNSSYIEDPQARGGVRVLTVGDPEAVRIVSYARAELVPVVVTPKKPKVGLRVDDIAQRGAFAGVQL